MKMMKKDRFSDTRSSVFKRMVRLLSRCRISLWHMAYTRTGLLLLKAVEVDNQV